MERSDLVEEWLDNVSISHSNSNRTRETYKFNFQLFCNFIGKTAEQIYEEYENSTDRKFRRKYAQYIRAFNSAQYKKGLAPCTIGSRITAIKSFCKYNDLPLGYAALARIRTLHHNRDITHEEIKLILNASRPREKAFFTLMAQSGLRPDTICRLKYEHIKEDFINNHMPCKIEVPQEITKGKYRNYFTFIGEEAVKYLQSYLNTRPHMTDEDYLFLKQGTKQKTSPKSLSNQFARTVQKLQRKGLIEVKQKQKKKPRNVRLYSLRKWFRKHANQAGFEYAQFWMGHIVKTGQEEHYRPTDVEHHRKLYAEKAMPFLRLETATPTETEKKIAELREQLTKRDKEIDALKETVAKIQPVIDFVNTFTSPRELKDQLDFVRADYKFAQLPFDPDMWFDKDIADELDEIVKKEGITLAEALQRYMQENWKRFLKGQEKFEKRLKTAGAPLTYEEYEEKMKKRSRKHMKKDSKSD